LIGGAKRRSRRELEDLGSAINMPVKDGVCRHVVKVTVPNAPSKRTTFLELHQVAQLPWAACRRIRISGLLGHDYENTGIDLRAASSRPSKQRWECFFQKESGQGIGAIVAVEVAVEVWRKT
jgi:hypothetical protein